MRARRLCVTGVFLMAVIGLRLAPSVRDNVAFAVAQSPSSQRPVSGGARNLIGTYGVYSLHPGVVFHHRLAVLSPGQIGDSLKRPYEISGAELNLRFPPVMNQGQLVRTVVTLRRLGPATQ